MRKGKTFDMFSGCCGYAETDECGLGTLEYDGFKWITERREIVSRIGKENRKWCKCYCVYLREEPKEDW